MSAMNIWSSGILKTGEENTGLKLKTLGNMALKDKKEKNNME